MGGRADIDLAIDRQQERVAELDALRADALSRLTELRVSRDASPGPEGGGEVALPPAAWSPERKVETFRSLFRGREDVFPVRWESRKSGRSGYSPRCGNEWLAGVCEKPRVKCGECPNAAFVAPGVAEIRAHLEGRRPMGVYPLLPDDTCRLLAIDLDGDSWRRDVVALRETCRELGLEPVVERSRSGNGAHVWFFFTSPVAAAAARRLGSLLLTETMARCPTLGMSSYDRLFPNQDTLPRGGFGNLIALPLEGAARRAGNTVFLDDELEPLNDQWACLASVTRIEPERVEAIVAESAQSGSVLGFRDPEASGGSAPWLPPRPLTARLAKSQMPRMVRAALAQKVYVERADLPPALLDAIRRIATFANPLFGERQRLRLSTARTPRVIACFEDLPDHLVLPRGCVDQVAALLAELGVEMELSDERSGGAALRVSFTGTLTAIQESAAEEMGAHEVGVLCAPPGMGKTVIAAKLIAARRRSTLVLVHRKPLLEQWVSRLCQFLDISPEAVGTIGAGKRSPNGWLDVAMVQTLVRDENLEGLLAEYGHVVVDECHHVAAVSVERVLGAASARYVTGLTATPQRRDGHQPIIAMQCGPTRHTIAQRTAQDEHGLQLRLVRRETSFDPSVLPTDAGIQEIYSALTADDERLELVVTDTRELLAEGRSVMVLTERREHLDRLADRLRDAEPAVLHGGARTRARAEVPDPDGAQPGDSPRLVLATGRYIGEGFDDPRLDTLVLAMPVAWKGTVVQYAGRLHRPHAGKHDVRIYDYVDAEVPVLRRMFAKRLRTYRALGYVDGGSALELASGRSCKWVESGSSRLG